jgi:hypothetical protein
MQMTAQVSGAYLTQPDFTRINTPQAIGLGSYLTVNSKLDLSYRWSPRVTSVFSFTDNALLFEKEAQKTADYNETVFRNRIALFVESPVDVSRRNALFFNNLRSESEPRFEHRLCPSRAEFRLSQRASGSLRLGDAARTFKDSGKTVTTPYAEMNLAYRLATASVLNVNARFGFEEPFSPEQERVVWRTGLSFVQVFTPRLNAVANINYLHEITTSPGVEDFTSDTFDGTVRLEYTINRRFSLNAAYTYTQRVTNIGTIDYYRNRISLGGQYNF